MTMMAEDVPTMGVDEASQWCVLVVTAFMILLFGLDYCRGNITWEGLYVCIIEFMGYFVSVALGKDNAPKIGPGNHVILRYVSWLLTCPILIKVLVGLISQDKDNNKLNQLIVLDVIMTMTGIFGLLYEDRMAQWGFFLAGVIVAFVMVQRLIAMYKTSCHLLNNYYERTFYMCFFFLTWTIFPVLYFFGPPMYGHISEWMCVVLHSFGDLVAKNVFTLMAWKMNRKWQPSKVSPEESQSESEESSEDHAIDIPKSKAIDSSALEEQIQQLMQYNAAIVGQQQQMLAGMPSPLNMTRQLGSGSSSLMANQQLADQLAISQLQQQLAVTNDRYDQLVQMFTPGTASRRLQPGQDFDSDQDHLLNNKLAPRAPRRFSSDQKQDLNNLPQDLNNLPPLTPNNNAMRALRGADSETKPAKKKRKSKSKKKDAPKSKITIENEDGERWSFANAFESIKKSFY